MKISIRYQIVGLLGTILILAMATYVYLAASLFANDKVAYIYDSNAGLVGSSISTDKCSHAHDRSSPLPNNKFSPTELRGKTHSTRVS